MLQSHVSESCIKKISTKKTGNLSKIQDETKPIFENDEVKKKLITEKLWKIINPIILVITKNNGNKLLYFFFKRKANKKNNKENVNDDIPNQENINPNASNNNCMHEQKSFFMRVKPSTEKKMGFEELGDLFILKNFTGS